MILCNIPGIAHPIECAVGIKTSQRMGAKIMRIGAGIGNYDCTHTYKWPNANLATVLKAAPKGCQYLMGPAPHNCGPISNIPDSSLGEAATVAILQHTIDQIHASDPTGVFEISNELNNNEYPGGYQGSVSAATIQKALNAWWNVWKQLDWKGHKLCLHWAGGTNLGMWDCPAGLAIIQMVKDSGGWCALNVYPNQSATYAGAGSSATVATFTKRFLTYTWINNLKMYQASVWKDVPVRLGETGVYESTVQTSKSAIITGAKLFNLRQGLINALNAAGMDFTEFAVTSTDPNMKRFCVADSVSGKAFYKDLNLA
jgi:hypothetical protein